MEEFILENDIKVFCVAAKSFPYGIAEAHQTLHGYVPFSVNRKYFGISCPDKTGKIIYKAATEELEKGELSKYHLEEFSIPKGKYIFLIIKDFRKNISAIDKAFKEILATPGIDPNGFCLEWYLNDTDCRCMVKLA